MKLINKNDFTLWVYYAAGQPIDRPVRNALAYMLEIKLRSRGFTSSYKFDNLCISGATDYEFENDAEILAARLSLRGRARTPDRITKIGKGWFELINSHRLKSILGKNYEALTKYAQQIVLANSRTGVVQKALYVLEVDQNLEQIASA